MTSTVQTTNSTTMISLNAGDFWAIIPGVSVAVGGFSDAVFTSGGQVRLNIDGYLYGNYGFYDTSSAGDNYIDVGSQGTISTASGGIATLGGSNTLTNAGLIDASLGDAVALQANNVINNSGTIAGYYYGIADSGGDNIVNSGLISSQFTQDGAIVELAGGNSLTNSGTISGNTAAHVIYFGGGANSVSNSGTIQGGQTAIYFADGGDTVSNLGTITGVSSVLDFAGTLTGTFLNNAGHITATGGAAITVDETGAVIENTGTISGVGYAIKGTSTSLSVTNSGHISGDVYFNSGTNIYDGEQGSINGTIFAGFGQNTLTGGAYVDSFNISVGADVVSAGGGADTISAGANLTAAQQIDGGDGYDTVVLNGDYSAGLTFGATTMVNVEKLLLTTGFSYNLTTNDATVAAGQTLTVDGSALAAANKLAFNGSAETNGYFHLIGGAGADTFTFAAANLSAQDIVQGGAGAANDTLKFATAGTISASALANVSGVETITLANGANSLTLTNALVASANGAALSLNGGSGAEKINASAVTTASDKLTFFGGLGADTMTASGGADRFLYTAANQSSGPNYDTIVGANFTYDHIDIPGALGTIKAVNTASGALSTATFDANLAAAISPSQLGAHDAVLFKATAGGLSGQTFLVINDTATAGFNATNDFVIHLVGQTGTIGTSTFI